LQSQSSPKLSLYRSERKTALSLRRLSCAHSYSTPPAFLTQAKIGLVTHPPELCEEGTGGTYFLKNQQNKPVAVFKPSNEDPLSLQNPKRTTNNNDFHFKGFLPGEGSQREIFAYLADKKFAGVPETIPAEISHWIFTDKNGSPGTVTSQLTTKQGSMQHFISDIQCTVDDMGYGKFSLPDVQKIAILDMLLVNCDRNGGNILVQKNSHKLVPIDHAFSLPDYRNVTDLCWFEWLTWRQVKQTVLPEVISFIEKYDIVEAILLATKLGIRKECLLTLQLSHVFLKRALAKKLTLYEIARLMCTRDENSPSVFAQLITKASVSTSTSSSILPLFTQEVTKYFS